VNASRSSEGQRISRRALLLRASALGLTAASSAWLEPAQALAASAIHRHRTGQPRMAAADHLVVDYLPSQPTGWGGVTIGGHVASVPFTFQGNPYEISLLAFGQTGSAPDPIYEPEPSDPTIDFKRTLQKAWGAHYSFRYRGGFRGHSKISVQSYNVLARSPTATQPAAVSTQPTTRSTLNGGAFSYGGDLFIVYEPDRASSDPPITDDLRWIQVVHTHESSFVDGHGRNPYYSRAGLTSIHGKRVCDFYDRSGTGVGTGVAGKGPTTIANQEMFETFLVHDTERKDRAGKGIIDIYGGIKWGWYVQAAQS
jgi:hypothetical protein